jgi:hypothetical protein
VLGINAKIDCLRTAKNYLYMLASVVYYMQVLGLEKLLLAAQRNKQTNEDRELFLQKRRQYLANSLYSLISKAISLLAYRKFVALTASNLGNAY